MNRENKGKKQVPRWKGQVELARSKAEFLVVGCEEGRDFQGERGIERQECSFCRRMLSSIIGLWFLVCLSEGLRCAFSMGFCFECTSHSLLFSLFFWITTQHVQYTMVEMYPFGVPLLVFFSLLSFPLLVFFFFFSFIPNHHFQLHLIWLKFHSRNLAFHSSRRQIDICPRCRSKWFSFYWLKYSSFIQSLEIKLRSEARLDYRHGQEWLNRMSSNILMIFSFSFKKEPYYFHGLASFPYGELREITLVLQLFERFKRNSILLHLIL